MNLFRSVYAISVIITLTFNLAALAQIDPGSMNESGRVFPVCDMASGFYDTPFIVKLSGMSAGDTLLYTFDGSDPRYSVTAISGISPIEVLIDPGSTAGNRGKTGGFVLRASIFNPDQVASGVLTRTYIFPEEVINQAHPGGGWPRGKINNQVIDLPMDPLITRDNRYASLMKDALLDIPTISVTTDMKHFFDPQQGIYVNAKYGGREWERPANIELIHPDGRPGFNIDAGIRIRGGWSRHPEFGKHAFRLFFRSEYGESKLDFPLFGDEGTDSFDKIDLRTSQNYSWSKGGWEGRYNTMNRDVFSRDTQGDMKWAYTRSRYYHLYLNGLYWGIFQTQERAEARFAVSYFGGDPDDYDVIKVDIGENWNLYEIEATDGNTDAWREIWNRCQKGFSDNADYFSLLGRNPAGEIDTTMQVWVDIDNLIDYMLIIFYGGNFDAPVSKFSNNVNPNNFYAIFNRNKKDEGFRFFIHDAEHTLLADPVSPGVGLNENRVNIGNIGSGRMNVSRFEKFHPQWLHHRLTQNQEYRMRFADRVYRHFFNEGVFNPDSCIKRFRRTADQLDLAIIAESARWGDVSVPNPRTKYDDWIPAVNGVVNQFMPYRTNIVLNQLINENLYVSLQAPEFRLDNAIIGRHIVQVKGREPFSIANPNQGGRVYYTINGNDPRAVGGGVADGAMEASQTVQFDIEAGMLVKARVLQNQTWSALNEVVFQDANVFEHLKITELHYHPPDQGEVPGTLLEFLELKNTGITSLDLSGLQFTEGIDFLFPDESVLDPGEFVVIASDQEAFEAFYGFPPSFQYTGQLSNSGEKIVLVTGLGEVLFSFTYSDQSPWPGAADGDGYSLVPVKINPEGHPGSYAYWTLSATLHGSPFADDLASERIGLQQMIEGGESLYIQLDEVFPKADEHPFAFSVSNNRPAFVESVLQDNQLVLTSLRRGDASIQLTAKNDAYGTITSTFRVLVYPSAHVFGQNDFSFNYWSAEEPEYSFPEHMIFLQTDVSDPGLHHPLLFPYFIAHDDYHNNDQDVIGFPYACSGRTRINALGDDGISFINTGRQRDLGGALLALDTRGMQNLQLQWTAETFLENARTYAIRLQYRTSLYDDFADLVFHGQVQEYLSKTTGDTLILGPVSLPASLLGKEYLQLLWRYYHIPGNSGARSALRLDDIYIGSLVGVRNDRSESIRIYSSGRQIVLQMQDAGRAHLSVYNLMGQEMFSMPIEQQGLHNIETGLPQGIYIVRLVSQTAISSQKIMIREN